MSGPETSLNRLLSLVRRDALRVAGEGQSFTLASGRQSHYFVDGKNVTLQPEGLNLVARLMLAKLFGSGVQAVGGMTLGADPIVGAMVALSAETDLPLIGFIVRKAVKDHGLRDRIAGPPLDGVVKVAMVEDTTTTGGSTLDAIACLREVYPHLEIERVLSIVDREEGAAANFAAAGYRFDPLLRRADLGV